MSIKTLRKRIALVAVSALGVGLLSVAPASAGTNVSDITAGTLPSIGIVTAIATPTTDANANLTATLVDSGTLSINVSAPTSGGTKVSIVTVSGGVFAGATSGVASYSADLTTATGSANTAIASLLVKPNSGATQMVIKSYDDAISSAGLQDTLTVTITTVASVNTFSQSKSWFQLNTSAGAATSNTDDTWTGTGTGATNLPATRAKAGVPRYFSWYVKDGNGKDLVSPNVNVSATSTGGCVLNSGTNSKGTATVQFSNTANSYVRVDQPDSTKPATCTVSLSVNGTAAATRTITFHGEMAAIVLVDQSRVKAQASATSAAIYLDIQDSAGNSLDGLAVAPVTAYYNTNLTAVGTLAASNPYSTDTDANSVSVTCVAASSNKIMFAGTSASGKTITSPEITVNCAGNPANYTATLDKAVYAPGDVATLTITAKDSKGNLTHDAATLGTKTTAEVAIAGSNLTAVVAPSNVDTFLNGVVKYKFIVGSTEGNYNLVVDLPKWNSTTYNQTAVTVAYSIKAPATGAVSNAEVLAAIVKLIASINKQIRALQKSLRR